MKIGITGHSKGLGKALFESLAIEHDVVGFSRTNGYDIKSPFDRKKIVKESKDLDVFVNLVHNYFHQTDMLYEMHKSWTDQNKFIINISSIVVGQKDFGLRNYQMLEYKVHKTAVENMIEVLNNSWQKPKICNYIISEINLSTDVQNLNTLIKNECKLS